MVRSRAAFGVSVLIGLGLGVSAAMAEGEKPDEAASPAPAPVEVIRPTILPRGPAAPGSQLVNCQVCAGHTCTTVAVRGPCALDRVFDALRREAAAGAPGTARHRSRAVTEADYRPVVPGGVPEAGRAEAAPVHAPSGAPALLLEIDGSGKEPLAAPESDSLSGKMQIFRPLILKDDAPEDGEATDGADDENEEGQ